MTEALNNTSNVDCRIRSASEPIMPARSNSTWSNRSSGFENIELANEHVSKSAAFRPPTQAQILASDFAPIEIGERRDLQDQTVHTLRQRAMRLSRKQGTAVGLGLAALGVTVTAIWKGAAILTALAVLGPVGAIVGAVVGGLVFLALGAYIGRRVGILAGGKHASEIGADDPRVQRALHGPRLVTQEQMISDYVQNSSLPPDFEQKVQSAYRDLVANAKSAGPDQLPDSDIRQIQTASRELILDRLRALQKYTPQDAERDLADFNTVIMGHMELLRDVEATRDELRLAEDEDEEQAQLKESAQAHLDLHGSKAIEYAGRFLELLMASDPPSEVELARVQTNFAIAITYFQLWERALDGDCSSQTDLVKNSLNAAAQDFGFPIDGRSLAHQMLHPHHASGRLASRLTNLEHRLPSDPEHNITLPACVLQREVGGLLFAGIKHLHEDVSTEQLEASTRSLLNSRAAAPTNNPEVDRDVFTTSTEISGFFAAYQQVLGRLPSYARNYQPQT